MVTFFFSRYTVLEADNIPSSSLSSFTQTASKDVNSASSSITSSSSSTSSTSTTSTIDNGKSIVIRDSSAAFLCVLILSCVIYAFIRLLRKKFPSWNSFYLFLCCRRRKNLEYNHHRRTRHYQTISSQALRVQVGQDQIFSEPAFPKPALLRRISSSPDIRHEDYHDNVVRF